MYNTHDTWGPMPIAPSEPDDAAPGSPGYDSHQEHVSEQSAAKAEDTKCMVFYAPSLSWFGGLNQDSEGA
jgi:hypothetical protein